MIEQRLRCWWISVKYYLKISVDWCACIPLQQVKGVTVSCCWQMVIHGGSCRLDVTFLLFIVFKGVIGLWLFYCLSGPSLKINILMVIWSPHFLCKIFYCAPQLEFLLFPVSGCSCTVTVGIYKFAFPYPKDFFDIMLALLCRFIFFLVLWQLSTAFGSPSSLSKLSSRRYSHSGYISQKGQLLLPLTEAS